jgi:signal transduction histidine kinase
MYASQKLEYAADEESLIQRRYGKVRHLTVLAFAVLLIGMITLAIWVPRKIESGVAEVAAMSTAGYVKRFIAPHLQELASKDTLSQASIDALHRAMERSSFDRTFSSVRIWKEDGLIIYSSERHLVGRKFPLNPSPKRAWTGHVAAEFNNLTYEEDEKEREGGHPLLEVFVPIRAADTDEVIAVLEFHEHAETLSAQIDEVEWGSLVATAAITAAVALALFLMVSNGGSAMLQLRNMLRQMMSQLGDLLRQNEILRARLERASGHMAKAHERFMPRVAAELQAGPAQMISLALLRLDSLRTGGQDCDDLRAVRTSLTNALADIRNLRAGLLLPEALGLECKEALSLVVRDHERRTCNPVRCRFSDLPANQPEFIKICLSRFVHECLENAQRMGGRQRQVSAWWDGSAIMVEVANGVSGMRVPDTDAVGRRLGLTGIWDRVESIGGTVSLNSIHGKGMCLTARLPMIVDERHEK